VKRIRVPCVITLILVALSAVPAARADAPTKLVETFGSLPEVTDAVLNPAGTLLAWRDSSGAEPHVVVFDIGTRQTRRAVRLEADAAFRSLTWADDDTLLITVSYTARSRDNAAIHRYESFRTIACDVNTGQLHTLLADSGYRILPNLGVDLVSWHTAKPHTVLMAAWTVLTATFGWKYCLYEVDTRTGKGSVIASTEQSVYIWVVDQAGAPVARSELRLDKPVISANDGPRWREIFQRNQPPLAVFGILTADRSVLAVGPDDSGRSRLWAVPLDGSGAKDALPGTPEEVVKILADPLTGSPVAARMSGFAQATRWLDPAAERRHATLARAFSGRNAEVVGRSESDSRLVAEVQGPSNPPVYYFVDLATHKADIVGEAYPALANAALGEVRAITYTARDGTNIPAYLTLPPGATDHRLPLVVLPHTGPAERDDGDFNWWAQFLAARGYAVLQPQFRGSSGFGEAFRKAGYRQWGGLMQDDVTDGVRSLIDRGLADPGRVCIVGVGGYAGYSALAGAAFTPQLYACAVSIGGIANLPEMLGYMMEHDFFDPTYLEKAIGDSHDSQVIDKSPVHAANRIQAPVLLIHGSRDTDVPLAQSEEMAAALKKAGARVTLVKLENADHALSQASSRVQVLKELDAFLSANLH
jgi:fermentation-respiration switch protein FrsA (DUF1100 family)